MKTLSTIFIWALILIIGLPLAFFVLKAVISIAIGLALEFFSIAIFVGIIVLVGKIFIKN